ncbi:MAG: ABC transporter substrate-binding protein [Burkholderiales bacterium]
MEREAAPDVLLRTATLEVSARLRQDKTLRTDGPWNITELVEPILPLFDFRQMTRLAVARSWPLASPEQQNALVAEFRTLLVRTYSTALARYRGQTIEYKPLRMAPGGTEVTVKSTVNQPGAERMAIDYDMEKTTAGWRVYDVKIAAISLITTYRSTFAQAIRDGGVDGLIESLSAGNRQADSGPWPAVGGARPLLFIYAVIPSVFRGSR